MENTNKLNILKGAITPTTIKLAMPIIIGHLLMLGYNFADTYFVSGIDKNSTALMSGMGLIAPIFFLFIAISVGFFAGMGSLVSRSIGANDNETLDRTADSGLLMAIIIAILSTLLAFLFTDHIIAALAGTEISKEAIKYATDYMTYIIPAMGMIVINLTLLGILQGEGNAKHYGITMMMSTILNIVLDPIFIYTLDMKVAGAALATSISTAMSMIYVLSVFIRNKSSLKIHWNIFKAKLSIMIEVMRIGLPQTLSLVVLTLSFILLNKLVSSIDETTMNAWVIAGRLNEFVLLVGYGIGQASLTMVGQNFGAKNFKRITKIFKTNIKTALYAGFISLIIYNIGALYIFNLFSDIPEVIEMCKYIVRFSSFLCIGVTIEIIANNSFQGTGKSVPGLLMATTRMLLLSVPISYINVYFFNGGITEILIILTVITTISPFFEYYWCNTYLKSLIKTNNSEDNDPNNDLSLINEPANSVK